MWEGFRGLSWWLSSYRPDEREGSTDRYRRAEQLFFSLSLIGVLVACLLAFAAGAIFSHTVLGWNALQSLASGFGFAALILAIDLIIVSTPPMAIVGPWSIVKRIALGGFLFGTRIAIALAVAIVVAESIVLVLFADVVETQLLQDNEDRSAVFANSVEINEAGRLNADVAALQEMQLEIADRHANWLIAKSGENRRLEARAERTLQRQVEVCASRKPAVERSIRLAKVSVESAVAAERSRLRETSSYLFRLAALENIKRYEGEVQQIDQTRSRDPLRDLLESIPSCQAPSGSPAIPSEPSPISEASARQSQPQLFSEEARALVREKHATWTLLLILLDTMPIAGRLAASATAHARSSRTEGRELALKSSATEARNVDEYEEAIASCRRPEALDGLEERISKLRLGRIQRSKRLMLAILPMYFYFRRAHVSGENQGVRSGAKLAKGALIHGWRLTEPFAPLSPKHGVSFWHVEPFGRHARERTRAVPGGRWLMKIVTPMSEREHVVSTVLANSDPARLARIGFVADADRVSGHSGFVVSEFFEQGSMFDKYRETHERRALRDGLIIVQGAMSGALSVLQHFQFIHGDIKPANIGIGVQRETGEMIGLLIDWGSANFSDNPSNETSATVYFGPPEVWRGSVRREYASLVDVFGFGATLYWYVTGSAPYVECPELAGVAKFSREWIAHYCEYAEFPGRLVPVNSHPDASRQIPPQLAAMIEQWLSPDPRNRVRNSSGDLLSNEELPRAMWFATAQLTKFVIGYQATLHERGNSDLEVGPRIG